jgi:hypothetical protein
MRRSGPTTLTYNNSTTVVRCQVLARRVARRDARYDGSVGGSTSTARSSSPALRDRHGDDRAVSVTERSESASRTSSALDAVVRPDGGPPGAGDARRDRFASVELGPCYGVTATLPAGRLRDGLILGRAFSIAFSSLRRPGASRAETGDTLRVLTYNIYYGGQDHAPVFGRGEEWLDVIRSLDPDLIFIEEANGWLPSEQNYIAAYVESLNASSPGEPPYAGFVGQAPAFHVALLSRVPVLSFEAFDKVIVGADTIDITTSSPATLDLGGTAHAIGVHFQAGRRAEPDREREARALRFSTACRGRTVWVAGDSTATPRTISCRGRSRAGLCRRGGSRFREGLRAAGYLPAGAITTGIASCTRPNRATQNTLSFIREAWGRRSASTLPPLARLPGGSETAEGVTGARRHRVGSLRVFSTYVYRLWTGTPMRARSPRPRGAHPSEPGHRRNRVSFELLRSGPIRDRVFPCREGWSDRCRRIRAGRPESSRSSPSAGGRLAPRSLLPPDRAASVETARFLCRPVARLIRLTESRLDGAPGRCSRPPALGPGRPVGTEQPSSRSIRPQAAPSDGFGARRESLRA